tara:strand:+ start:111 stop:344 length:234 start_codon:yes stop_codon:yes gene_type:complete
MDIYVWHISAKGNQYLKVGRHLCVVGQSKLGWWALVSDEFLENKFDSEEVAKEAAVNMAIRMAKLDDELGVIDVDSQ